jgi:integrase/recombinase XerC
MLLIPRKHAPQWFGENLKSAQQQDFAQTSLPADNEGPQADAIECALEDWLLHCYPPTTGKATPAIYRKILTSLRGYLQVQNLDLDSPAHLLTPQIASWAVLRTPGSKRQGEVAPATYNQRIAAIGSFYSWARARGLYAWPDPTEALERSIVQKYVRSSALDVRQIRQKLQQIDRSTPRGQRDYALLQVALNTGRSARELAGLRLGDLSLQEDCILLAFTQGRGGKILYDLLDARLSQILSTYLRTIYSDNLETLGPQSPVWVSFSDRTYGQPIGQQTIADICEAHLGITHIQQLRHTFAFTMDRLGAPVDLIQNRLGHESRATTSVYLAELRKASNPYAARLGDAFGL